MERESEPREVTILLGRAAGGDEAALDELVYAELQRLASQKLSGERRNHTLGPDDLVHEAWVRLIGSLEERHWADREHFRRAMAEVMRRVLIDHARRRGRARRGGGWRRVPLEMLECSAKKGALDLPEVDEMVRRLEEQDPRLGRIVRLRYYAGLSVLETAEALGVSEGTVYRDWAFARSWLCRALKREK